MSDTNFYNYLDPHIDTEGDVLKIRKRALELYRKGTALMEWNGEGTTGKRQFVADVQDILRETRYFLKTLNPQKYGRIVRQSSVFRLR